MSWLEFTLSELAQFDGKKKPQTYVAFQGDVYDVANLSMAIYTTV